MCLRPRSTKDLTGEENLVLSHIKIAAPKVSASLPDQLSSTQLLRTGIWTKHLKAKTNLHQTVIDRCLKTLVQKRLIKRVPSVQHPTRKIYMLEGLEPSIALTGGPWYTQPSAAPFGIHPRLGKIRTTMTTGGVKKSENVTRTMKTTRRKSGSGRSTP